MNTPTNSTVLIPCLEPADDLERHSCPCGWRGTRDEMEFSGPLRALLCPECAVVAWRF